VWRRCASGLHQPLGLRVVDGKVCVLGRDRITRLHDLNGDGEADYYESMCDAYLSPTGGHDYVTGLQRDPEGRFYFASGKQGLVRTSADLKSVEVLATGFRNPNGIGLGPRGEVTLGVQEGDWTPASMVHEIIPQPGEPGHYGHGGPRPGPRGHMPPLVYLPRGEDNSCGGQCFVEGDRWGVPAGTLVHFSWGTGRAFLILRERLGDVTQGCAIALPGDFRSGAHRGRFNPRDGQLYVTGMTGWTTFTPDAGCLHRMRYTGGPVRVPLATEARDNGVLLRFADPLAIAGARFFAQQWNYRYAKAYGSAEYSVRQPDKPGHDALAITSAHSLENGRALFLEIPQLQPCHVLHLHCDVPGLLTRDYFLTLHQLGPAFTHFPGYRAITKTPVDPHAGHHAPVAALPVKWEQGEPGRALRLRSAAGMQFEQKELRVRAGERLSLTFENPDPMPHNFLLVQPGCLERVGTLADRLIVNPEAAAARHYVPDSPEILCHTRVLDPQRSTTIHFTAPAKPGRYPYVCTFPGHWRLMRGELVVE
jgi:azurin